jgi:hypothetical protein
LGKIPLNLLAWQNGIFLSTHFGLKGINLDFSVSKKCMDIQA